MTFSFHNEEKNTNSRVKAMCTVFLGSRVASKARVQSLSIGCFFLFERGDYIGMHSSKVEITAFWGGSPYTINCQ